MSEYLITKISAWFGLNEYFFTEQVISFLGILNVILVVLAGLLFTLRRINKYGFSNKNPILRKIVKPLSKLHPFVGVTLLISAYVHGELALGSVFRIHTGSLAWWILLLMMLVALLGKKFRIKQWLKIHRILAILMIVSVLLHLFVRNILG